MKKKSLEYAKKSWMDSSLKNGKLYFSLLVLINSIKKSCETTIKVNQQIMDRELKDYDGRYFDEEREEYTILETEINQSEIILHIIKETKVLR